MFREILAVVCVSEIDMGAGTTGAGLPVAAKPKFVLPRPDRHHLLISPSQPAE